MVLNDKRKNNIKPLNIILTSIKYNSFTQIRGSISKLATFGGCCEHESHYELLHSQHASA